MNIQPAASSEIRVSLPWCAECADERAADRDITWSDGSEAPAFCSRRTPQELSSLNLSREERKSCD